MEWTAAWVEQRRTQPRQADEVRADRWPILRPRLREALGRGVAIPAHPLALTADRKLDERRQVALTRYYCDAGAGGVAVGVHTTQFAIRDPRVGLLEPVLALAMDVLRERRAHDGHAGRSRWPASAAPRRRRWRRRSSRARLGYDAGPAQPGRAARGEQRRADRPLPPRGRGHPALRLLPAARGGRTRPRPWPSGARSWRSGRWSRSRWRPSTATPPSTSRAPSPPAAASDVALYTGNDDAIVADLITPLPGPPRARAGALRGRPARPMGGLDARGGRAARTRRTAACRPGARAHATCSPSGAQLTDANAALFDARNGFAGCIAGLHEVLRAPGPARRALVPRSRRGPLARPDGGDRPRAAAPIRAWRRRVRPREPGSLAGLIGRQRGACSSRSSSISLASSS